MSATASAIFGAATPSGILCLLDGCSTTIANKVILWVRQVPKASQEEWKLPGWLALEFFVWVALGHLCFAVMSAVIGYFTLGQNHDAWAFAFYLLVFDGILFLQGHNLHHLMKGWGEGWGWQGFFFCGVDKGIKTLNKWLFPDKTAEAKINKWEIRVGIIASSVDGFVHGGLVITTVTMFMGPDAPIWVIVCALLLFALVAGLAFLVMLYSMVAIAKAEDRRATEAEAAGREIPTSKEHSHGSEHDHAEWRDLLALALTTGLQTHALIELDYAWGELTGEVILGVPHEDEFMWMLIAGTAAYLWRGWMCEGKDHIPLLFTPASARFIVASLTLLAVNTSFFQQPFNPSWFSIMPAAATMEMEGPSALALTLVAADAEAPLTAAKTVASDAQTQVPRCEDLATHERTAVAMAEAAGIAAGEWNALEGGEILFSTTCGTLEASIRLQPAETLVAVGNR